MDQQDSSFLSPSVNDQTTLDQDAEPSESLNPEDQPGYARIFVANLPFTYSEQDVRDFLSQFGTVDKVYLVPNHDTGKFKGQVKASFTGIPDIQQLIENIRQKPVNDVTLRVEEAYTKEQTYRKKQEFRERSRRAEMQRREAYQDRYSRGSGPRGYYDRGYNYDYDRPPRRDDYYSRDRDYDYRRGQEYPPRYDYRDEFPRYSRMDDYPPRY